MSINQSVISNKLLEKSRALLHSTGPSYHQKAKNVVELQDITRITMNQNQHFTNQRVFSDQRLVFKQVSERKDLHKRNPETRTDVVANTRSDLSELQASFEKKHIETVQKREENEKNLGKYWVEYNEKYDTKNAGEEAKKTAQYLEEVKKVKTQELQGGWDKTKMSRVFLERFEKEKQTGLVFKVDLKGDTRFENNVGAAHILPSNVIKIMVKDPQGKIRIGIRRMPHPPSNTRIGYFDEQGYIPIYSGYTISILETIPENSPEAVKQKAQEDMVHIGNKVNKILWKEDKPLAVADTDSPPTHRLAGPSLPELNVAVPAFPHSGSAHPERVVQKGKFIEIKGDKYAVTGREFWEKTEPVKLVRTNFMGVDVDVNERIRPYLDAVAKEWEKVSREEGSDYPIKVVQCYNPRPIRGGTKASYHTWAVALDINPDDNPYNVPWGSLDPKKRIPERLLGIFKAHGFRVGAEWENPPDAMHVEFGLNPEEAVKLKKADQDSQKHQQTLPTGGEFVQRGAELVRGNSHLNAFVTQKAKELGIDPAFALAIMQVEAGKKGIGENGPTIRMEPHVFNRELGKKGKSANAGSWGQSKLTERAIAGVSCEGGQDAEYRCFAKAKEIDEEAAYNSISIGLGQVMGFNAELVGYKSARVMFDDFSGDKGGEGAQITAMFQFIAKNKSLLKAAQNNDYRRFAAIYNGAAVGSRKNEQYAGALSRYHQKAQGGTGNRTV